MLKKSWIVAPLLATAFIAGAGWAALKLWPYRDLHSFASGLLARGEPAVAKRTVVTDLATLEITTFSVPSAVPIEPRGGGIDAFGNDVLIMSYRGQFYLYRGPGAESPIVPLDIEVDNGYDAYLAHFAKNHFTYANADNNFRFIDVVYDQAGPVPHLWVTHHQWHDEDGCFTVRLSRLALQKDLPLSLQSARPGDWQAIYDTAPCLPIDASRPVFNGHLSGGRLIVAGPDAVLMTVGDHEFNGWDYPEMLAQDPASDYGKILLVRPSTGSAVHLSTGHRNPQGLLLANDDTIWSTEHGPRGGDELNRIAEGNNYGWPFVTYGVQYGMTRWPLSDTQNRHDGYTKPVFAWIPSIGVSNLIQVQGFLPAWDGDLLVGSLVGETLHRLRYSDGRVIFDEPVRIGERVRDLDELEDGTIVVWTNDADIVEIRPAKPSEPDVRHIVAGLPDSERQMALSTIGTCLQCHHAAPDYPGGTAPNLWRVFGRRIAATDFSYSEALRKHGGRWDDDTLAAFLGDVQGFAQGSTMTYPGVTDPAVRLAVIDYLKALQ